MDCHYALPPTAENGPGVADKAEKDGSTYDLHCTDHSCLYSEEARKVAASDGADSTGHMLRGRTDSALVGMG